MNIKISTILIQNDIAWTKNNLVSIINDSVVVVIDVLRASTTICSALYNGAKELIPCSTIEDAKDVYSRYSMGTVVLCGERNGIKPDGFDLGNSPSEYSKEKGQNKTVILTTTNGTLAFEKVKNAKMVLIGCFANLSSIETALTNIASELIDVVLLCAGNYGKPTLEDTLCAGALLNKLVNRYDNCYLNNDSKYALNTFLKMKDNLFEECYNSDHGKRLIEIGFKDDIDLALKYDIYPVVPVLRDGFIKIP